MPTQPKLLLRHDEDRLGHLGAARNERHRVAVMHDVGDAQQQAAQLPAGMEALEIAFGEVVALQQRQRQRVAQRHHHGRRRGRRQSHRAGLDRRRQAQHHVGGFGEAAPFVARHRHERDAEAPAVREHVGQFRRLARVGEREDRVVPADIAEIAVARLGGMDELRRRAGRGEGRGDLARDMAALAHAGDDDAARHRRQEVDGPRECLVESGRKRLQTGDFGLEHAPGDGDVLGLVQTAQN